jgi:IS30 family transposase
VRRIWPGLALLNYRPRKALGYRKPSEEFAELVAMTP